MSSSQTFFHQALIAVALVIGGCGMIFLFLITAGQPHAREDGTVEYVEDELVKVS